MVTASAIYEGNVRHRRRSPKEHQFSYSLFMMYLDLDELPDLFDRTPFWSARRFAPARFCRRDHFGDPDVSLKESVTRLVEAETGRRCRGPIRLLTHLRYFGYCFNPISLYYCFSEGGDVVETVVAEVHNTPWNETHCYVLVNDPAAPSSPSMRQRCAKTFHVSPFMEMNHTYHWELSTPSEDLLVHLENWTEGDRIFNATLRLRRRALTPWNLNRQLVRYPAMTMKIVGAIYVEALRLWWKGLRYVPHPDHAEPSDTRRPSPKYHADLHPSPARTDAPEKE
ncbi:hypothetical protein Pan216_16010 [Planctomycetes bacterium Pan216]|uniref:DUF1365 domain-containing protein n=1 Tax=Kolteria novifilia TaxID=2527975 RepID=A0A518B199_9BACT|nr:hypothetical protein Pan216_16010 [Planctomycetes bacterium Pan216]